MPFEPVRLQFRTNDGEMDLQPGLDDFYSHISKTRVVLLIHGFNNTLQEAKDGYDAFVSIQQRLADVGERGDFAPDRQFLQVFWKGDAWGRLSGMYYMDAIPNAVETAMALGRVLTELGRRRSEGLDVDIVAHSLGTRLAFEMLKQISGNPRVRVNRIVMFAAATPTYKLEDAADSSGLRPAYDKVLREGLLSLYSGADDVLAYLFPLGQTLAKGHEGFFPTAVGHRLWGSPNRPGKLDQQDNRGAGHSDYWGWKKKHTQCERFANLHVREYLRFTTAGARATAAVIPPERDTLESTTLPLRETAARVSASRAA